MAQTTEQESMEFFRAMHQAFGHTLAKYRGSDEMLGMLLSQVFNTYEGNVKMQTKDLPEPDCHKGCATCCSIRVVATAPEVLLVARYIRAVEDQLKKAGIDLVARLTRADEITRGHNDRERVTLRQRCPFIHRGACAIYSVRPLACRSHISYSKKACLEAAAGHLGEIPYSEIHMTVRSLTQNAMQSTLRDANYPWATYELNHALSIALEDDAEETWLSGLDLFAPAMVEDVSMEEMASTFDRIHGRRLQ